MLDDSKPFVYQFLDRGIITRLKNRFWIYFSNVMFLFLHTKRLFQIADKTRQS